MYQDPIWPDYLYVALLILFIAVAALTACVAF